MAFFHAGAVVGVKPAAIVRHGEEQVVALDASGDTDCRSVAVSNGVCCQFSNCPEDGVRRIVRQHVASDIEANGQQGLANVRFQRPSDGLADVILFECVVSKVPETVSQFVTARFERSLGNVKVVSNGGWDRRIRVVDRPELKRHSGQVLGNGVVKLNGETRALLDFELGLHVCDDFVLQLAFSAPNELPQDEIDDGAEQENRQGDGQCDGKPTGRPPRWSRSC